MVLLSFSTFYYQQEINSGKLDLLSYPDIFLSSDIFVCIESFFLFCVYGVGENENGRK